VTQIKDRIFAAEIDITYFLDLYHLDDLKMKIAGNTINIDI
jgi:hypothetical protein